MAEIKKITLKVGKHEFTLTLEETKELRDILNKELPEPKPYIFWPPIQQIPAAYPTIPYYWEYTPTSIGSTEIVLTTSKS